MLELENYGKMIAKEEFTVDVKNHQVIDGLYMGSDKFYYNGFVGLDMTQTSPGSYKTIITKIAEKEEDGKIFEVSDESDEILYTSNIRNLRVQLACKDSINENGYDVPTLHTWDNAKIKDENFYTINFNGIDINCPKEHNLLGDKYFLLEYNKDSTFGESVINNKIIEFYCHEYGLMSRDLSENSIWYYMNPENKLDNQVSVVLVSEIVKNPNISLNLPNISVMPARISYLNDKNLPVKIVELTYDDDGLLKGGENCLYESYSINGIRKPLFSTSLHPFYFDTFDTGLIAFNGSKFCIDQVNRYLDNDILEYTREIYEIDEDKKEELIEEIKKAKEQKEHAIPTI